MSVCIGRGSEHDFSLLKRSNLKIHTDTIKRVDLGYVGMGDLYKNVIIPHKKPKGGSLTKEQKQENKRFSRARVAIEHVNRKCKIFRIVGEVFRGKKRDFNKIWNAIAGLANI